MNDARVALSRLDDIIDHLDNPLSFPDKCGLYAATRLLHDDLQAEITENFHRDGYALEKLHKALWSIGAALGFDIDNGHPIAQHRAWAMGSMSSLRNQLDIILQGKGEEPRFCQR